MWLLRAFIGILLLASNAYAVDLLTEIQQLKAQIHTLSDAEIQTRFSRIRGLRGPPPKHQEKIDHFVVLLLENHAADMMFGCMDLPGFDGIKGHKIPKDPKNLSKGFVNVTCGAAPYVCKSGPGFSLFNGKFAPGADAYTYPYGEQNDSYSYSHGAHEGTTTSMFSAEQLPVKHSIAKNFGVFNKLYTASPTASTPNHLMIQSATSCGIIDNIMYSNKECGGAKDTFPQFTIYDSLHANNVSFALYMNSTCGLPFGNGTKRPACHGENPDTPDAGSPVPSPDVALEGVGRYKDHFKSQGDFYEAAAAGTLPSLSWVLPHEQACDHPCHDNAKGERLLKDVYEAVRAGPKWEKTLLLVVYDDAGGYYDHIVPPHEGVAADEAPCRCPNAKFDFKRLGLRSTAMLISPWVKAGSVFQEPKGPTNTSQFDLTSVSATLYNLFNLTGGALTKRDAWSGSFHELLLDSPREGVPMHLPDAPTPGTPWEPPHSGGWPTEEHRELLAADGPEPQHCSLEKQTCLSPAHITMKQRKRIVWFSRLTSTPEPNIDSMNSAEAERWLAARWDEWMGSKHPHNQPEYV